MQKRLKALAGVDGHVVAVLDGGDGLFKVLLCVALRHVQKFAADAEFGTGDRHSAPRARLREGAEQLLVKGFVRDDLVREFMCGVVLGEEGEKALPALARALGEGKVPAALHDAAARDDDAHRRIQPVALERPDVGVHVAGHGGDPAFAEAGEHLDLVAVVEGEFKFLVLGKGGHLLGEKRLRLLVVAR